MALLSCAGLDVLSATLVLPRTGAWYADLTCDGTNATAPAQGTAVQITSSDQTLTMVGTVMFSGIWQERITMRIDGGGGGVDKIQTSRYYASSPTLGLVLRDLMRDAGEQLDSSVDSGLLNSTLANWARRGGTTASLLGDLVRFGCPPGTIWRTLANGNIWLGTDTYSTTVTLDQFDLMDEKSSELRPVISTETPAAALIPGVLFVYDDTLAAGRVSQVEHHVSEQHTSTTLWLDDPTFGDRTWSAMARSMAQMLGQVRFQGVFPGTVTAQDSDGTLQVQIDDPTQITSLAGMPRLPNLTKVAIRTPFPSSTTKVAAGARVDVAFEGGSPQNPVVVGWDPTVDQLTELDCGGTQTKLVFTAGNSVLTMANNGDVTVNANGTTATLRNNGTLTLDAGSNNIEIKGATVIFKGGSTPVAKEGSVTTGHTHNFSVDGSSFTAPSSGGSCSGTFSGTTASSTDTVATGAGSPDVQVP